MTQLQMAKQLANKLNITESLAEMMIQALCEVVIDGLRGGDEVALGKLGTFYSSYKNERVFYVPDLRQGATETMRTIVRPSCKRMQFRINKIIHGRIQ